MLQIQGEGYAGVLPVLQVPDNAVDVVPCEQLRQNLFIDTCTAFRLIPRRNNGPGNPFCTINLLPAFLGNGGLEGFWKPLEVARYRFLGEAERLKPPFSERKRAALERFSEAKP